MSYDWVIEMESYIVLEEFDRQQEMAETGHLEILEETCRILNGLKLCSRNCVGCQIACNIAEIALPPEKRVETWDPSPVVVRRR